VYELKTKLLKTIKIICRKGGDKAPHAQDLGTRWM
jgi:hypothetical protein